MDLCLAYALYIRYFEVKYRCAMIWSNILPVRYVVLLYIGINRYIDIFET